MKRKNILISLFLTVFLGYSQDGKAPYLDLKVMEAVPEGRTLLNYPEDHMNVKVNPPGFTWIKNERANSYDFILFKDEKVQMQRKNLSGTIAALKEELVPGEYSWVILYNDSTEKMLGRSKLRSFTLDEGRPSLKMPDMKEIAERLKDVRPRIFLTPSVLAHLKKNVANNKLQFWKLCRSLADSALTQVLPPEPAPYKDSVFDVSEWRRIYRPAKSGSANMVRMALVWRVTNEGKYLKGAKNWLLHFASWDPNGITSFRVPQASGFVGNTEASMPMLERMSMVYDWIWDELNQEEKKEILASINARGNQMLKRYTDLNFISEPWDNHTVRSLAFTGLAGLATLGDLPDAQKWLDYVIRCYITSFPTWGGDDGGWAQGLAYSSAYNLWQTNFVDAMNLSTDVNLYNKPFFRNNGYFGVYCHPPYATLGAFGDGGDDSHSPIEKILHNRYAMAYNDPVLLWQAENIDPFKNSKNPNHPLLTKEHLWQGYYMEDIVSILTLNSGELRSISPSKLPRAKLFKDIGWVAMHSDMGSATNDVWMLFKSSPFGSFSHSHADQNSFQINAYGESLIIDSGYYPWYGSPHQQLWSRQTKAHNAILINGRGQSTHSMKASGTIEAFKHNDGLTIVTGECATAYNIPLDNGVIELWEEYLDEPIPNMRPEAHDVRRTVVFNHDKENPWIVVQDYIKAESPAQFDYMLHALEKMKVDSDNKHIQIQKGNAIIDVYLLSSKALDFSQTDKFTVDPDESDAGKPNQWHFSASNPEQSEEIHFLALMIPRHEGGTYLKVRRLEYDGTVQGFQIGNQKILGWFGKGEKGDFSVVGLKDAQVKLTIEGVGQKKKTIVH